MTRDRRRFRAYYERWNLPQDTQTEFPRFKNRILAAVDHSVGQYILNHPDVTKGFLFKVGVRQPVASTTLGLFAALTASAQITKAMSSAKSFADNGVYRGLEATKTQGELILALQCLFWCLADSGSGKLPVLAAAVKTAVDTSPFAEIAVAVRGNTVTLYPRGARLLDDHVVEDTLAWLRKHYAAAKHFESALRIYLAKNASQFRNLLDELRAALEKLLRSVLGNRKSLENQASVLLPWLKDKGVHTHVRDLYRDLLKHFTDYQNAAVKHGTGWVLCEVEYMIYLTGTFMRILLVLNGDAEEE
ncbi:hypothetical protein LCGC14_0698120 [marine sediment metagenome]|uniref:Uncharacterized protein n=1 Tax=marine sediment metagenome TaxID=412755 RepID=A0A0F9QIM6_9ZZZZ|nr:hypothetical protein [Phycisphaerae bacterium]HDZ44853.1 hypothetical protein [Phycisphaerae bacterium]